jgi:Flp pilus assembly protein CpaB
MLKHKKVSKLRWLVWCALSAIVAFPSNDYASRQQSGAHRNWTVTVKVFIATRDLPRGMVIKGPSKDVGVKQVMPEDAPEGAIGVSGLHYEKLKKCVKRGSVITQQDCLTENESLREFVTEATPPGYVAMAVEIGASPLFAGWWQSGSRADILLMAPSQRGQPTCKILCHNGIVVSFSPESVSYVAVQRQRVMLLHAARLLSKMIGGKLLFAQPYAVQ